MNLTEEEYERRAYPELKSLVEALDGLGLDGVECELASDILNVEFADGTQYVVNSHRAARQIWVAAERNAWHFDWDPEERAWIAKKTREELWSVLARSLSNKLGTPVPLTRPARDSAVDL